MQERTQRKIDVKYNGSAYGDGIYTADSASSFWDQRYGTLGLLVARLRGQEGSPTTKRNGMAVMPVDSLPGPQFDSVITRSIVVLRKSSQCVAVLSYDVTKMQRENPSICPMYQLLQKTHREIQGLIDNLLNQLPTQTAKPNAVAAFKPPPLLGAPPAQLGWTLYNTQTNFGG